MVVEPEAAFVGQLLQDPAGFARGGFICQTVIDKIDMACTLNEPIHHVGRNGILVFQHRQSVDPPDAIRNKTVSGRRFGHNTLIKAQDHDLIKIKVPGFQQAHQLNAA
ncbi:hypothetical protein D3C86_1435060 [compost metagenome]